MSKTDLEDLANELAELAPPEKKVSRSPREERIIAGFEEIQRFVKEHGDIPRHGEERDIFERIYAVRLDRLRALQECRELLETLDDENLLVVESESGITTSTDELDDLAAELEPLEIASDLTELRHVRTNSEKKAAEEIANRIPCKDFEQFKPMFDLVHAEIADSVRKTVNYEKKDTGLEHDASISKGDWFILEGQTVYVADIGEVIKAPNGSSDARLRAIYSNGTESDILKRSLQRALYKDDTGRRITESSAGPLFGSAKEDDDAESGTIYILRSKSDHPEIATNRNVLHKIGVTNSKIETRIANAKLDPTFLMAEVEIVATYDLFNINRVKLENLIHRFFSAARLDLAITDRFGNPIKPREWFLVPLPAIDSAVQKIQDGTISEFEYEPASASLRKSGL